MDFDHTYNNNGSFDWSMPSPTATPTTNSFAPNVLHTPKTATFSSHHFNDAFATPQMPGYTTPRQPDYATMTPMQGQEQLNMQEMLQQNYQPNMQEMPPPRPTQPQQPYQGATFSPVYPNPQGPSIQSAISFDSSQMQTPPPTRGTSVKRPTPSYPVAFGTPSTIASRRFVSPQQAPNSGQQVQEPPYAPMQFPHLHFPTEAYQFGHVGPASAPVFTQTQLLWEQATSLSMYQHQPPALDDPFAPNVTSGVSWSTLPAQQDVPAFDTTPAMSSFPLQASMHRPGEAVPLAPAQPLLSPPVMTTASVNPSLVYSSPIRPTLPANTPQSKPRLTATKPEPKRKDSGNAEHKRTETVALADAISTPASKMLRRSNTTDLARLQSAHPNVSTESLGRSNSVKQPPRTMSPLKRTGKAPLGSISEIKRPSIRRSVILTVDENGRASTETRPIEPVEDSPTRSMRQRYPGLFDSDSSEEESEGEESSPSLSASFSFTRGEERKSKVVKLDPPVENLEGLSIPRSSSSASMRVTPSRAAIAAAAQLRRGGSLRKATPSRNGQRRIQSSASTSIDTAPMDITSDHQEPAKGGAEERWHGSTLEAHNRRWSMMSMEQQQSISPTHQPMDMYHHMQAPVGRQVRCSCGVSSDRGQPLIQCASCTQWCHAVCVGLNPTALPPTFTCFLCTKPTSSLQVGRVSNRKRS